jgi:uncharacterized protein YfaS (alpha-2-macroglobulin family)
VTQEVPIGNVKGKVLMGENGRPLEGALVTLTPKGVPDDVPLKPRYAETKGDGTFEIRGVPADSYEVEVAAKYHVLPKTFATVVEGPPTQLNLNLERGEDRLSLYASQRVFTPDEKPEMELHGFVQRDAVDVEIRRVDVDEIAKKGGLQDTLSPLANGKVMERELDQTAPLIKKLDYKITKKDAEGAFIESLPVQELGEGFYWVTVRAGDTLRAHTVLSVSRIALITKNRGQESLMYATDLVSGKPIANVAVSAQGSSGLVNLGRTGRDGTLSATLPKSDRTEVVVARHGKSVAVVGFWTNTQPDGDMRIVGYTDRPVYRPGDTIKFKGIVRRLDKTEMRLPRTAPVDVELRNPDDEVLGTARLEMTPHGSFHGEFPTSPEAAPGYYRIVASTLGTKMENLGVTVASYRKPEYKVDVRPQGGPFILGQKASVVVDSQYYFGGPVVGAKVKASVYRSPYWRSEGEFDEEYEGEYYESYGAGDYSQEIEGVTDVAGRVVLEFPTRADEDPDQYGTDYTYTVVASVADEAGKYFDGQGEVRVYRGKVDLDVQTDQYVASPGETVPVRVKVTDATDPKKPVANHEVTLEVGEWRWTRRTSVTIPRDTLKGTTDAQGVATFNIPFKNGGDFVLKGTTDDGEGRQVVGNASIWVEGGGESAKPAADLTVRLDKKKYEIGDQARVLLETDKPGGSALVTIQAEGILSRQVVPLTSRATLIRVPVTKAYAPNVYVSAAYVREKQFREDTRRLVVNRDDRAINVEVTPDRPDYQPGETARLTVKTTDPKGKPVAAELSVGVVDESIYAIQEDRTNLREMLNPNRMDLIQTHHSFPEVYLDGGDKGSANIPLRKKFEDTAAWIPTVWTGEAGQTTVEVKLPDNLTQWRTTAIGVTDSGAAGQIVSKFRARKPLMVRVSPPAYLVQGDRQQVAFSVTNDTGAEADVRLELGAEGLKADGDRNPRVRLAAGETQAVNLDLTAGDPGEAVLTARAWIDEKTNDGVEQRFQVVPHGRQKIDALAVEARPTSNMEFELNANAAKNAGALTIAVTPTLAGGAIQALDTLVDYPYGCVEQTMSRFMPAIVVADALQKLNLERPELTQKIPKVAADSMARLARMQHGDGGWGWWEYDGSDLGLTALVLDGLDRAKRVGYQPTGVQLESALSWSANRLEKPTKDDVRRDRLYLAYALLRHGKQVPELTKIDMAKAESDELAIAALAFHEAGETARCDEMLRRLTATAVGSQVQARWESPLSWGEEPTALALVAFSTIRPDDPIISRVVRGLMARRKGKGWHSTRDTSYSVIGLVQVLANSRENEVPGEAIIRINDREIRRVAIDPTKPEGETVTIPRNELEPGALRIEVERTGTGVAYASAELRQFVVEKDIPAVSTDPDLRVTRAYYVMEPRRLEDGSTKLMPSAQPVNQVRPGDLVRVVLTINTTSPREFVMVEDPTPSHCRVTEREDIGEGEEWVWWWSRNVIRDDRIAIFARNLPKGESKVAYTMRAEGTGTASALPTWAGNMYDPSAYASTGETRLEIAR